MMSLLSCPLVGLSRYAHVLFSLSANFFQVSIYTSPLDPRRGAIELNKILRLIIVKTVVDDIYSILNLGHAFAWSPHK